MEEEPAGQGWPKGEPDNPGRCMQWAGGRHGEPGRDNRLLPGFQRQGFWRKTRPLFLPGPPCRPQHCNGQAAAKRLCARSGSTAVLCCPDCTWFVCHALLQGQALCCSLQAMLIARDCAEQVRGCQCGPGIVVCTHKMHFI